MPRWLYKRRRKKWITNNGRDLIQFSSASASFLPRDPQWNEIPPKCHQRSKKLVNVSCLFFLFLKRKKEKSVYVGNAGTKFLTVDFCRDVRKKTNRKGRSLPPFYADEPCGCSDSIAKLLNRIPLPEKSSKWAFDDREKAKHLKQNIAQHFLFSSEVFGRKCKTPLYYSSIAWLMV